MKTWFMLGVMLLNVSMWAMADDHAAIPLLNISGVTWTDEEIQYIRDLHQRGRIAIATKISTAVYQPEPDGSIRGFHYNVFREFANLANIAIDVRLVSWNDYFYKAGADLEHVKVDAEYAYVPTLIENVDLYIDGITALPWREKMFGILTFVPSRQLIVARKTSLPLSIEDLNDTICAMVKDTSLEFNLERLKREHHLRITYLYTDDFDAMERLVAEGQADFTVYDSDRAFLACYRYPQLTIAMPVSDIEIMGWGIHKNNRMLKRVLEKYLRYAQQSGILDTYWKAEYGVSFIEYLKILKLR